VQLVGAGEHDDARLLHPGQGMLVRRDARRQHAVGGEATETALDGAEDEAVTEVLDLLGAQLRWDGVRGQRRARVGGRRRGEGRGCCGRGAGHHGDAATHTRRAAASRAK
jgi:hypothetical protein